MENAKLLPHVVACIILAETPEWVAISKIKREDSRLSLLQPMLPRCFPFRSCYTTHDELDAS